MVEGVRQINGRTAIVTPAIKSTEDVLLAAYNRTIVDKREHPSLLHGDNDEEEAGGGGRGDGDVSVYASSPLVTHGAPRNSINDNITDDDDSVHSTDKDKREALAKRHAHIVPSNRTLAKLGVVFTGSSAGDLGNVNSKEYRQRKAGDVEAALQGVVKTEDFPVVARYINFSNPAIAVRKPPPKVKRLVSKRFESEEEDASSLASVLSTSMLMELKSNYSPEEVILLKDLFEKLPEEMLDFFSELDDDLHKEVLDALLEASRGDSTISVQKLVHYALTLLKALKAKIRATKAAKEAEAPSSGELKSAESHVEVELDEAYVSVELRKVTATTVSMTAMSADPGRITVILVPEKGHRPDPKIPLEAKGDMAQLRTLVAGLVDVQVAFVGEKDTIVVFKNLDPEKTYKLFTHLDCNLVRKAFYDMTGTYGFVLLGNNAH